MYDSDQPQASGSMKECKPNYEEMAAALKKKMDIHIQFKASLIEFVQCIGSYRMKREPSSLPELLGKVELDIVTQNQQYSDLLSKIEGGS